MGNCCCADTQVDDHSSSTNLTSTPGTSKDTSNGSAVSNSSAGNSGVDEQNPNGEILPTPNLRIFGFAELKNATQNFDSNKVLGEGNFGKVFKGLIDEKYPGKRGGNGKNVAIKKLNPESLQGNKEWKAEVTFLGSLSHPNLVKLLGYCKEKEELLLVYEYMQNRSLGNHLFSKDSRVKKEWDLRLKIMLGAARGLAFLHSSEKQIIYRDFKASNILLDKDYNAKLSDFGFAKNGPIGDASHVSTLVLGTDGYVAPEYIATGHLYVKSDVFGFGVVLLEMLTGKRALDTDRSSEEYDLVDWLKPSLADKQKLTGIMDPRLKGIYPSKAANQAVELTLKCLDPKPSDRPSMKEVVESLERIQAIKSTKLRDRL